MWHNKAHRLIAAMCTASYQHANRRKDGTYYKKHRPYSVPAVAQQLLQCLNTNDEEQAKRIFLDYPDIADEYKR